MSPDEEACSMQVIEFCRTMNRKAADQYVEIGARPEDIAIGALFSALDLATVIRGDPFAAIEWLRTGLDAQERQLLERGTATVQ